jgi:hypothetical protein
MAIHQLLSSARALPGSYRASPSWWCCDTQAPAAHSNRLLVLQELFDIDLEELGKVAAFVDSQDEGRRDLKGIHKEVSTILYQVPRLHPGRQHYMHVFRQAAVLKPTVVQMMT